MMHDIVTIPASVKHTDHGLSQDNPTELKVRLGQEAMARQRRRWEDWLIIAEALDFGRTKIMGDLYINAPVGRRYESAMAEWLTANGFREIDKGARSRLLECLQHRDEIEQWRALLTDGERFHFNHPSTVWRKWKGATAVPDPNATPKLSPFTRLKAAHAELLEEHHQLQRKLENADGDLWRPTDKSKDIAKVMFAKLTLAKAEDTGRDLLKLVKEAKASRSVS